MRFNVPQYNPTPIESPQNALARGLELQRAQQGHALQRMQMEAIQAQQMQAAQERARQEQQRAMMEQWRRSIPSPQMQASQQALAGGGGPTVGNAARMPAVDPRQQMLHQAWQAGVVPDQDYIKAATAQPKADDYKVVGGALVKIGPQGVTEAYRAPKDDPEQLRTLAAIYGKDTPAYQQAVRLLGQKLTSHAPAASITNYGAPVPVQLPDGSTGYVQPSNRGGPAAPMATPSGDPLRKPSESSDKPLSEGQAKAMVYAARMLAAEKTLAELNRKGVNVSVPGSRSSVVGPVVSAMSSPDRQRLDQAKRDFINAVLRRESGAVIAQTEFDNGDKQYFPQVGDSREVIEQKARNRRVAIEGIRADVPKAKQGDVDAIAGGGAADNDPLGLRGK